MKKIILTVLFLLISSQAIGQSRIGDLIQEHPDWIWPRSDAHTVISPLGTIDNWKTYIEPGGSFSPGFDSYGVSFLIYDSAGEYYAPELVQLDDIESFWEEGHLPVYNCRWPAGKLEVEIKLFTEKVKGEIITTLIFKAKNISEDIFDGVIYVTLRPYGPAGGNPYSWDYDSNNGWIKMAGKSIALNHNKQIVFGSVTDPDDITPYLKKGSLPEKKPESTSSALQYNVSLSPGDVIEWQMDFIVHPSSEEPAEDIDEFLGKDVKSRLETVKKLWKERIERVSISVPDIRVKNAFYSSISQILNNMVSDELRITPVSYPLFWLRDNVYMMDLLEKADLSEFLEGSYNEVVNNMFMSGLGPEADAPGEGLWILGQRMKYRPDKKWLKDVYPSVKEKAELIIKMMTTNEVLRGICPAFLPLMPLEKNFGIYCMPQKEGLIYGIMDTHTPILWVNFWSLAGLRTAGEFAKELRHTKDEKRFKFYYDKLDAALSSKLKELLGHNDRDWASIIWPTDAFSPDTPGLKENAYNWWMSHKEHDGNLAEERNWLYFELAQAHNMFYLGLREKAWMVLERYLKKHDFPDLYVYKEGDSGCADPFGLWDRINGWHKKQGNMPHGWISAELALLIRDMLYYEYNGQLVIGAGIPDSWMIPGNFVEVRNAPTLFGRLNYEIKIDKNGKINIDISVAKKPPRGISLRLPRMEPEVFNKRKIKKQIKK